MSINKVKGYRNMLNLTQQQLADKLDISKQSYYLKETGQVAYSDKEKSIAFKYFQTDRRHINY